MGWDVGKRLGNKGEWKPYKTYFVKEFGIKSEIELNSEISLGFQFVPHHSLAL